jgi:hypothetical protein
MFFLLGYQNFTIKNSNTGERLKERRMRNRSDRNKGHERIEG